MQHLPPQRRSVAFHPVCPLPLENSPVEVSSDRKGKRYSARSAGADGRLQVPIHTPAFAASTAFTKDARNLLTALGLYADLLHVPGVLSERHGHYAGELRLLADRSCALLGRVLGPPASSAAVADNSANLVRAESSRCQEPLCDAALVLQRLLPSLQEQTAGAATVVLRLPAGELPPLPVSGEALERVAAHLVSNAAGPAGSGGAAEPDALRTVWLGLGARDGSARLTVEDSGTARSRPGVSRPAVSAWESARVRPSVSHSATQISSCRVNGPVWEHRSVQGLVAATGGRLFLRARPSGGTAATVLWTLPHAQPYPMDIRDVEYAAEKAAVAC